MRRISWPWAIGFLLMGLTAGAAAALIIHLPPDAKPADFLSMYGSLIGSTVAIATALLIVFLQFDEVERRHQRTMKVLLDDIERFGGLLFRLGAGDDFAFDQPAVRKAASGTDQALKAAMKVADKLRAEGPNLARVAQALEGSDRLLGRLAQIENGLAPATCEELRALGTDVQDLGTSGNRALTWRH